MLASLAFVVGIVLGVGVYALAGRGLPPVIASDRSPTVLGWWTLALGTATATAFLIGSNLLAGVAGDTLLGWLLGSIVLAIASVIVGVATVLRGDRRWPSWLGLVLGAAPALAWVAFAVGSLLGLGG